MTHIFVSHSSEDLEIALRISRDLLAAGYDVWLDEWNISGKMLYWDEIQFAIETCAGFLFLLSPKSIAQGNGARKELYHVANLKPSPLIVPCLVKELPFDRIPIVISPGEYQIHDFVKRPYEEAFARVVNALSAAVKPNNRSLQPESDTPAASAREVFLAFRGEVEPDQALAHEIEATLEHKGIRVTRGAGLPGESPAAVIGSIGRGGVLIALCSARAVESQIFGAQIASAHESGARILPLRVNFRGEFPYHLETLNYLPWAVWDSLRDTPRLLTEIETALEGGELPVRTLRDKAQVLADTPQMLPSPQPYANPGSGALYLEPTTGTVNPQSRFYVERAGDAVLRTQLAAEYATIVIKAPRQLGKSSLLMQGKRYAEAQGKRVASLDFQSLDRTALNDDATFFRRFAYMIARALRVEKSIAPPNEFWEPMLGHVMCCSEYVEQHILPALDGNPAVLAIDEVDRVLACEFRSDFFGMLRHWHNCRAESEIWRSLSLALVISTEPRMLIEDPNQSPFNVGVPILLEDFDAAQIGDLNMRHERPLQDGELSELMSWIGGHPYLTRTALYQVASRLITPASMFRSLLSEGGPFADHLNYYLFRFSEHPDLGRAMLRIIQENAVPARDMVVRLQSAGLIRQADGAIVPRCRLYAEYFARHIRL